MNETNRLRLPLVQPSQAQKHVTVNEALAKIDGLTQLSLVSRDLTLPPDNAAEGDCYAVPEGAVNEWAGRSGQIAIRANGGWVFVAPHVGWRAWLNEGGSAVFNGSQWVSGAVTFSPSGSAFLQEVLEIEHVISAGSQSVVAGAIPAGAIVFGVTGRIRQDFTGSLTSWRIGADGSDNRYGSGIGLDQGAWLRGLTGAPQAYYADTDLVLSGEGGDFTGGAITLAIHYARLTVPN